MQDNLLLTKSNYQKLSESLRAELDMYIKSCEEKYTKRTNELLKIHCSKFLIFLQSHGINSVCKISCDIVCKFFEYEMPINPDERYVILSNSRLLLQYYVDMGKCEPVLPLLLEEDIHKYAILLEEDNLRVVLEKINQFSSKVIVDNMRNINRVLTLCKEFKLILFYKVDQNSKALEHYLNDDSMDLGEILADYK